MFHVICEQYGYNWHKAETRKEAEAWLAEHTRDGGTPPHPARGVIEEGEPFEAGHLFDRSYRIRKRLYELRNVAGEVVGIIGRAPGRGSRDYPYQLRHSRLSKLYSGMSLFMALTNHGKGGQVDPGAAAYIQGPDHRREYGAIVEAVKLGEDEEA